MILIDGARVVRSLVRIEMSRNVSDIFREKRPRFIHDIRVHDRMKRLSPLRFLAFFINPVRFRENKNENCSGIVMVSKWPAQATLH